MAVAVMGRFFDEAFGDLFGDLLGEPARPRPELIAGSSRMSSS